jgi:uncharacterized protein involved in type VI secretion and phage assembly
MTGLAGVLYEYVLQYNQSDWDFLWARARLLGYQLYAEGTTLRFTQASLPRNAFPTNLTWGTNLRNFKPRFVSSGATTSAQAHGWNSDAKKGITSAPMMGLGAIDPTSSPGVAKGIFGSIAIKGFNSKAKDHVISPALRNPAIATAAAKARFLEHESHYVRAWGEAEGDPSLMAGSNALVSGVGTRFSGVYFVTQARHIFRSGDYKVEFEISGRNPFTLGHLTGQDAELNKIYGAVIAVITDNNDPMMEGRMKVKYPWMPPGDLGSEVSSGWARMASLGGGKNGGIFFTPEVNDEVLVVFEHGDVSYPFIVGVLWNKIDRPPGTPGTVVGGGKVNQRIIKSRSGHVIVLDDTQGKEKITILDKNKNGIEIDSVKNEMTITTAGNLTIDVGGKLTINSKMDFIITSKTQGSIKATSKLELEGTAGATVKAGSSELALDPASAALKSTLVDIQANGKATVKGSGMVEIQGGIVKIN